MKSELQLGRLINLLPGQAAVADEFAIMSFDDPEPVTVLGIVAQIPVDPCGGFPTIPGARVVLHDLRIAEEVRHIVEIMR